MANAQQPKLPAIDQSIFMEDKIPIKTTFPIGCKIVRIMQLLRAAQFQCYVSPGQRSYNFL